MLKVAITGNIASGKSRVEEILKNKSFNVLDVDEVAHDLLKNITIKEQIMVAFNGYDIIENDEISRSKMGKLVFTNEQLRKTLESILYPTIKNKIIDFFERLSDVKMAFVSIPLLFEAKFENLFDKIILVYSDDDIRLERLMKRNDLSPEQAQNRIDIQMYQDEKLALVDFVIYNNKTLDDLKIEIDKVLNLL